MHVVVTGAGGFIGSALAERLQSAPLVPGTPLRLTLVDRVGPVASCAPGVQWHIGSFAAVSYTHLTLPTSDLV